MIPCHTCRFWQRGENNTGRCTCPNCNWNNMTTCAAFCCEEGRNK